MSQLENIPKENPFKVPDGYFNRFPDRLEKRLSGSTLSRPPLVRHFSPALSYAAMFLGLLAIGYLAMRLLHTDGNGAELSYQEMALTIDYYAHEFEYPTLTDAYLEVQAEIAAEAAPDDNEMLDEEIIEYLSSEPIDLTQYYAE